MTQLLAGSFFLGIFAENFKYKNNGRRFKFT